MARRFGREKCWRVQWPDGNDTQCKDANECLLDHGPQVVRECIEAAFPYPIAGLHNVLDYRDATLSLYRDGRMRGHSTGWATLEVGALEVGTLKVGTLEKDALEAGIEEVRVVQMGTLKAGALEMGSCKIGTS